MKLRLILILIALSTMMLGFRIIVQADQITNNAYDDTSPHVKGDFLVWQGLVEGDWEIFLFKITTGETFQITNNDYGDVCPQTDGHYVAWLGFSNSGGEIFLYDISNQTPTQITTDTNVDSPPQIANGLVVWSSSEVTTSVEPGEIFLYRTTTQQTEQLTDNALDDGSPGIDDTKVVWVENNSSGEILFIYELPAGPTYQAPEGFVWEDSSQTDGNLTVYSRVVNGDREIFARHKSQSGLQTYRQISDNDFVDKYPRVSKNKIAWVAREGAASEIFLASHGPAIKKLRRRYCNPGEVLPIIGNGFGETQGNSVVHINNKVYDSTSPKVKLWSDTKIQIRIPTFKCQWFKGKDYRRRKVWLTVDGIDSNLKRFKVVRPGSCP